MAEEQLPLDGADNADLPTSGAELDNAATAQPTDPVGGSGSAVNRRRSSERASGRAGGSRGPAKKRADSSKDVANPGGDLERRVGRTEFNDGALVRLRVPIRVDADAGRDVLTDIDVLALDVDGRLRISRSILECKSGKGQSGEPDRLLWLSGLQRYLRFDRAVLVRQTASRRGRTLARALGLRILDAKTLSTRESGHVWVPERFAHLDGVECERAETRTDTQLKALGHIASELVAFLRYDALQAEPHRSLRAVATLGRAVENGGVLPNPTRLVLAGHALFAVLVAALTDAGRLDELSPEDVLDRTRRGLVTGNPDDEQVLAILARADEVMNYASDRLHSAYGDAGAKRLQVSLPSLRDSVATPPPWVPRYVDLVERLRANPSAARQLLQTSELSVFDALVGGTAYKAEAFNHLFSPDHRYLLNVSIRCLEEIAGSAIADPVSGVLDLDFERGAHPRGDRDAPPAPSSRP